MYSVSAENIFLTLAVKYLFNSFLLFRIFWFFEREWSSCGWYLFTRWSGNPVSLKLFLFTVLLLFHHHHPPQSVLLLLLLLLILGMRKRKDIENEKINFVNIARLIWEKSPRWYLFLSFFSYSSRLLFFFAVSYTLKTLICCIKSLLFNAFFWGFLFVSGYAVYYIIPYYLVLLRQVIAVIHFFAWL